MNDDLIKEPNFWDIQKVIIWDGESCNLNLVDLDNKPWNWGILVCEGEKIIKEHNLLIKWPELKISKQAAQITRFDPDLIQRKGIDPLIALDILDSYIYDESYWLIGHNILFFDVYLHNIHRLNCNKKSDYSYINRIIDTNSLAKGIKNSIKYNKKTDNLLAYQYKVGGIRTKGIKTNLTFLGKELEIDVDYNNLHQGINDCFLLKDIWNKWLKYHVVI